jgi:hypothetical protein
MTVLECPLRANSGHRATYSINSSARPISVLGTVMPSALAAFRFRTNSTFADCCTGRSAGFSPFENTTAVDGDLKGRFLPRSGITADAERAKSRDEKGERADR